MKKLLAFLSFLVFLTAFTCENEPLDDGFITNSNNNESIEGTWSLVEFEIDLSTSTNFGGQEINAEIDLFSTEVDYIVVFGEDAYTTNGDYTYNASISVDGNTPTNEVYTLDNVNGTGTYTTNGNEITASGSFFEFDFEGMDLSSLEEEQTVTFEISNGGQTLTFTQSETITETDPVSGLEVTSVTNSVSIWSREDSVTTDNCSLQAATEAAALAYNNDNSNQDLCIAYKEALENQIAECGDDNGSLQAIVEDLGDCSENTNSSSGNLSVTVGTLNIEFTQQDIDVQNGIITVSGASESGNYSIYFQVTEGDTGTDVLQNFVLTLTGTEYFPSTQGFDDFTSETTVSSGGVLQATFFGLVESNAGADLSLTQGMVDITY